MANYNDMSSNANDIAKQGMHEMKKSGEDWMNYVEKHPLQSMIFGTVIFFAIKGIFK